MANFDLTTADDTFTGDGADDVVTGTGTTLNVGDRLSGGAGNDTLSLSGGGEIHLDQLATFTGFEHILITSFDSSFDLYLGNLSIDVNVMWRGGSSIHVGTGLVTFFGRGSVFSASAANWNAGNSLSGDNLTTSSLSLNTDLASGATYDLTQNTFFHINILGYGDGLTLKVDSDTTLGISLFQALGANSRLETSDAALDLTQSGVSGFSVVSTNVSGTNFTVNWAPTALQIVGGPGTDTITAPNLVFTAGQRNAIFTNGSIERIVDASGTYYATGDDVLMSNSMTGTLSGGAGNDTYIVTDVNTTVVEQPGEGADTVYASVNYTTRDNVEGLVLLESGGAINGFGGAGNETIYGNSSSNWLDGGGGSDALMGGGGNDTLIGGAGVDGMAGGLGDDTYVVDDVSDQVIENAGEGADTVYASTSYTLWANVEALVLMEGAGAINGTGSDGNDTIFGNSANNVLTGGAGSDALTGGGGNDVLIGGTGTDGMAGGLGDDTYVVDNTLDQIQENAGEGADTVYATINYALFANLEGLVLVEGSGAVSGTGNDQDNYIFGNSNDNVLRGLGGHDVLFGGDGHDILLGDAGNDVLVGGAGNDDFRFASGFGIDTIDDFSAGDLIWLDLGSQFTSFSDVQPNMTQVDATTTAIVFGANERLSVHHAPGYVLSESDFIFGGIGF